MRFTVGQLRQLTKGKHALTVLDLSESGKVEVIHHVKQTGGRPPLDHSEVWELYANHDYTYGQIAKVTGYSRQSVRNIILRLEAIRIRRG